jgi:hypothetical protein
MKYNQNVDRFEWRSSYKGRAGFVDNERDMKGLFLKGTSRGSSWVGSTPNPSRKQAGNFLVLSTDYENYAILYQCTYKTVMYNKDIITVLLRDPDFSKLQSGTEEKIMSEF